MKFLSSFILVFIFVFILGFQAQAADVPIPNDQGDYQTAFVSVNGERFTQQYWLVIDPTGLNCRSADLNQVLSIFPVGAIIKAYFPDDQQIDAISLKAEQPYLMTFSGEGQRCFVRGNHKYIAPISSYYYP